MVNAFGYETDVHGPLKIVDDMLTGWVPYMGTVVSVIVLWIGDFIVVLIKPLTILHWSNMANIFDRSTGASWCGRENTA